MISKRLLSHRTRQPSAHSKPRTPRPDVHGEDFVNATVVENPRLDTEFAADLPDTLVNSFSNFDRSYAVSLSKMSCNCPDFILVRSRFDESDPRRACKHLAYVFLEAIGTEAQNEIAMELLQSPAAGKHLVTVDCSNGMTLCFCFGDSNWVDVITRTRRPGEKSFYFTGPYRSYGYNLEDSRWSYGKAPAGAKLIKSAIRQITQYAKRKYD